MNKRKINEKKDQNLGSIYTHLIPFLLVNNNGLIFYLFVCVFVLLYSKGQVFGNILTLLRRL